MGVVVAKRFPRTSNGFRGHEKAGYPSQRVSLSGSGSHGRFAAGSCRAGPCTDSIHTVSKLPEASAAVWNPSPPRAHSFAHGAFPRSCLREECPRWSVRQVVRRNHQPATSRSLRRGVVARMERASGSGRRLRRVRRSAFRTSDRPRCFDRTIVCSQAGGGLAIEPIALDGRDVTASVVHRIRPRRPRSGRSPGRRRPGSPDRSPEVRARPPHGRHGSADSGRGLVQPLPRLEQGRCESQTAVDRLHAEFHALVGSSSLT